MTTSTPPIEPDAPVATAVPADAPAATRRGIRVRPKTVVGLLIFIAAVWFALANTKDAQIKLWVHNVQAPVWLVLLCTFVAGVLVGLLARRRRRKS
jgi:uncharacterized integral membrane protein